MEQYCNALDYITRECRTNPKTAFRWHWVDAVKQDKALWTNHPRFAEAILREFERLI